jgi:GH18 family chitinase
MVNMRIHLEDFINVMTYDLHGDWDNFADHHAPLHARQAHHYPFKLNHIVGNNSSFGTWQCRYC